MLKDHIVINSPMLMEEKPHRVRIQSSEYE